MVYGWQRDDKSSAKGWVVRLDRVARELNVILVVIAIGLAILDFTCFLMLQIRDALPPGSQSTATSTMTNTLVPIGPSVGSLSNPREEIDDR